MSIQSKRIRKAPPLLIPVPLVSFDADAKKDVLGQIFAAHDRIKEEQRIADQIANLRFTPTRRIGTPAKEKSRKIVRITDKKVERIIQASTQPKQPPSPIKPIERAPNPFIDQYKDRMEALFERIDRMVGPSDTSNE